MSDCVYTIGHSNHSIDKFLELLAAHSIQTVADVRSHPYSRYNPQFNREYLQAELRPRKVAYQFLGRELGARAGDSSCYIDGKVDYDRLAQTNLFRQGIAQIVEMSRHHPSAIMCAEKDPLTCHRAILIGRHLQRQGLSVLHILETGEIEPHDQSIARLRKELGLPDRDLFRSAAEITDDAYELRGREIAYNQDHPSDVTMEGEWP